MKNFFAKVIVGFLIGSFSSNADIGIQFYNNDTVFTINGLNDFVSAGDTDALLIWAPNADTYQSYPTPPANSYSQTAGIYVGEIILAQITTQDFGLWDMDFTSYSDENVGGMDINTGYLYGRVKTDSYWVDFGLKELGNFGEFNALDISTIIDITPRELPAIVVLSDYGSWGLQNYPPPNPEPPIGGETGPCSTDVVSVNPFGAGTISISYDDGISADGFSSIDMESYEIFAEASSGYQFSHWSNDSGNLGIDNPISFVGLHYSGVCPLDITTLTAHFNPISFELGVQINGLGHINHYSGNYNGNTNLNLIATPNTGWLFTGWSGDITGDYTESNKTIIINENMNITANFSDDVDEDGFKNTVENYYGLNPRYTESAAEVFGIISNLMTTMLSTNDALEMIKDLRVGSQTFGVSNGNAKIRMFLDESSDLTSTWSNTQHVLELDIPANADTKFYRFRMD